jgi:hypothetical protein
MWFDMDVLEEPGAVKVPLKHWCLCTRLHCAMYKNTGILIPP